MPKILHIHFKTRHNVGDAAVVLAVREQLDRAIAGIRWSSLRINALRVAPTAAQLRRLNAHDLVVIGGGGVCSHYALPVDPGWVRGLDVPLVLYGVGHNRHLDGAPLATAARESLAALAARARLVSVRDGATRDLLAELGVAAEVTGDPAALLAPRRDWWRRELPQPAIGLNIAAHGWSGQDRHGERLYRLGRDVLQALCRERGATPVWMEHTGRERPLAARLAREVPGLRIARGGPRALLHHYGRLDLVVSMMLHSSLLAWAAGTPVINLAYDVKNQAFMRDSGQAARCLDARSAEAGDVLLAARRALAEGPLPADRLDGWRDATARFAARVAALLGTGTGAA